MWHPKNWWEHNVVKTSTQQRPSSRKPSDESTRYIYLFHQVEEAEKKVGGDWDKVRGLLGGKGANLADMTRMGVPVCPGFTVTTLMTDITGFGP